MGSPDGNKQKADETEPRKTRNFKALESQNKNSEDVYKSQAFPGNNRIVSRSHGIDYHSFTRLINDISWVLAMCQALYIERTLSCVV